MAITLVLSILIHVIARYVDYSTCYPTLSGNIHTVKYLGYPHQLISYYNFMDYNVYIDK